MAEQLDRFRSFLERYVIVRAPHFEAGREQEQAWVAIQDAKKIYGMIAEAKNETDHWPEPNPFDVIAGLPSFPSQAPPAATPARARNAARALPPAVAPGIKACYLELDERTLTNGT